MKLFLGIRKVLIFLLALVCFESILLALRLTEAAAIVAVGTQVALLMGGAIYGNVKEHQAGDTTKPGQPGAGS